MACPICQDDHTVEIRLSLRERDVTMNSCSRCDTRWWRDQDERLELREVLALAGR